MPAHIKPAFLVLAFALSASLAACGGKGTEGTCTTYPACGGDPMGNWTLSTGCQNLVVMPYQQPSLPDKLMQPQTTTVAPPSPMPTTSGDWCSQLVYEPSINPSMPVRSVVLWHGPPTVHDGYLKLKADGTYQAHIQFITLEHTFFPNACITKYERTAPTCEKLGTDLASYEQTQPGFMFDQPMNCTGDSSVGCDCTYHYQVQTGAMGTWSVDPAKSGSIIFAGTATTEPQAASFCQTGDTLQLTGEDGTNLFGNEGVQSAAYTRTP